jgi:hypothetical protein
MPAKIQPGSNPSYLVLRQDRKKPAATMPAAWGAFGARTWFRPKSGIFYALQQSVPSPLCASYLSVLLPPEWPD